MINENLSYGKKIGLFLDPFLSQIWPFSIKNQVFGHFLRNCTSDLSKTWSETGDKCFESSNGSFGSGKFLDGSPDVFRLWKEPINSLSYVRTFVCTSVPVLQL